MSGSKSGDGQRDSLWDASKAMISSSSVMACGKHHCENGSVCVKRAPSEEWMCDCDTTTSQKVFAGMQCQHAATKYCTFDGVVSKTSFCTNSGRCKSIVAEGQAHEGCDCSPGFEGDHCQFTHADGNVRNEWPDPQTINPDIFGLSGQQPSEEDNDDRALGSGPIAAIVFLAIFVASILGIVTRRSAVRRKYRREALEKSPTLPNRSRPIPYGSNNSSSRQHAPKSLSSPFTIESVEEDGSSPHMLPTEHPALQDVEIDGGHRKMLEAAGASAPPIQPPSPSVRVQPLHREAMPTTKPTIDQSTVVFHEDDIAPPPVTKNPNDNEVEPAMLKDDNDGLI